MKKIVDSLYLFSKLTTSLILFLLLAFLGYIFVNSYKIQNNNSFTDEKLNSLMDLINNNSQNLKIIKNKTVSNEIEFNNLKKIMNNNFSSQNDNDIKNLLKENNLLKNKIDALEKEITNIKKKPNDQNNFNGQEKSFDALVAMINLKYQNGLSVSNDILLLQKINTNLEYTSQINKLLYLSERKFIGLKEMKKNFNHSVENYLHEKILKKNKSTFVKVISNFVKVKPSTKSNFANKNLQIISDARKFMEEKKIDLFLERVNSLNDSNKYFKALIDQSNIFIEFNTILKKITKNA